MHDNATATLRWKPRWWHFAIVFVVLAIAAVFAAAYAMRLSGLSDYNAVIDRLRAAGQPASIDDFVALAPAIDQRTQNDWDAWQKSMASGPTSAYPDLSTELAKHSVPWNAWVTGRGPRPDAVAAVVATHAPRFAAALPPLRHGGLIASGFGFIVEDLPPGKRRMPFTNQLRIANLFAGRELALWLRHAAVLADEPTQHLADLDAFHSALQRPSGIIDSVIALSVGEQRDRAYVELALRGQLTEIAQNAWLAEASPYLRLMGDGFSGESVLMGMGAKEMLEHDGASGFLDAGGWQQIRIAAGLWVSGYRDCALVVEYDTHVAQRLRGQRANTWPTWEQIQRNGYGRVGALLLPNMQESAIVALIADAHHHCARVAVQIIDLARSGKLPADQITLLAALGDPLALSPPGDHLHLRYEVPAPGRFRLVIDPASPLPNFDDPTRMPERTKPAGTPAAKESLVWERSSALIEIALPLMP